MKDKGHTQWEFNGKNYKVGECIYRTNVNDCATTDTGHYLVYYAKRLYVLYYLKDDRCGMVDLMSRTNKVYWTKSDKVFKVLIN